MNGVHPEPGPHGMGHLRDLCDRVDGADAVGCIADGDEPGAGVQKAGQLVHPKGAVGWVEVDLAHNHPSFAKRLPRGPVRVVVQAGDEDLVPGRELPFRSPG